MNIELNGIEYQVETEVDQDSTPLEDCGHGDVSEWTTRSKYPGEVVIAQERHSRRYYDMNGAVKRAREEGWNTPPYEVLGETAGQQAARAAQADFDFLRRWFAGRWHYVRVVVKDPEGNTESLWGVEDYDDKYVLDVAKELAGELECKAARRVFPVSTMGV